MKDKIIFKTLMLKGDAGEPTDQQTLAAVGEYMQAHPEAAIDETIINSAVDDWLDDHPEATTTVQDGSLTENKFSDALKLKTIKDYVTPQMYGAKGDGIADDTLSLQSCFNDAYGKKLSVFIPSGTYNHTGLIIPCADFGNAEYIPRIYGNDRATAILNHTGSGIGVSLVPVNGQSYIDGIKISGLHFKGNENTTIGLELHKGTRIEIDNIKVTGASVAGIKQAENFWVSSLTNIFIGDCATGVNITGNSVTSILYNSIYVYGSTATAFHLTGIYSEVGILAADYCTGDYVYNFDHFSGTVGSIGCENCNVSQLLRVINSTCSVNSAYIWNPVLDGTLVTPIYCVEAMITITALAITGGSAVTSEIPLAKMYYTYLTIDNLRGNYLFSKPVPNANGDHSVLIIHGVKIRVYSYRPYLGTDRYLVDDLLKSPFDKTQMGVAIYTSCTENPSKLSDGTSARWSTPAKAGDWFIESNPGTHNVAGYVVMQDSGGDAWDMKYAKIPVLIADTTTNRPSTYPTGGMYFDTTLGKPIFYNGSSWVDATGTSV